MSFAAGFAAGLAVGRKKGGGTSGPASNLRAIVDNDNGVLKVRAEYVDEETNEVRTIDRTYTYDIEVYSKSVSSRSGNTITTQTYSKQVITALKDPSGKTILRTDWNKNTGEIYGYYDSNDDRIFTEEAQLIG